MVPPAAPRWQPQCRTPAALRGRTHRDKGQTVHGADAGHVEQAAVQLRLVIAVVGIGNDHPVELQPLGEGAVQTVIPVAKPVLSVSSSLASSPACSRARRSLRACLAVRVISARLRSANLVSLIYVDNYGKATGSYPFNPNGSPSRVTGFTTRDGRVTILMPHPERIWRTVQHSWAPAGWGEYGPRVEMFRNARRWTT